MTNCLQCGLSLQGRDNESDTCSDCLLEEALSNNVSKDDMSVSDKGLTDEQYKEKDYNIMKVKKLIELLSECDQDLPVFIFADDEIHEIALVDNSISDRVDLNMEEEPN